MEYNFVASENYKYLNAFIVSDFIDLPIHIINEEGFIIFVNKAWSNAYKIRRDLAVGKHIQEVMQNELQYFLSLENPYPADESVRINDLTSSHLDDISNESAALKALHQRKKISMVTSSSEGNKIMVTSTPVFSGLNEIVYVYTFVQNLTEISKLKERLDSEIEMNNLLKSKLTSLMDKKETSKLFGKSKKIRDIKELIPVIAKTDASILILGESGVGKEVLAKEIYLNSNRADKPFLTINCSAIPENLLESEMFGYEKGAFTGAVTSKPGLFEVANGGTIFLDEIGTMPLSLQPKLLRVLQENEFMRVGGTKKISLDVRFISATNEKLMEMISSGKFRQDLYYRLNVIPVKIPPLKDRKDDIRILSERFLDEFNKKYNKRKMFNESALAGLEKYDWPGNIRELRNAIERLVIIGEKDVICENQLSFLAQSKDQMPDSQLNYNIDSSISLKDAVKKYEKALIQDALKKHKTTYGAAKALRTSQSMIARKSKSFGINKDWE
ncbi:sigma-54 interaction domain-containing protein [Youngiibacter fragilis]|nr:sigma 54-interacting transcriptional regulator [Youngiibacter fragilis]